MTKETQGNTVDQAVNKMQGHPWLSGGTLALGGAGLAEQGMLALSIGMISPFLALRETVVGIVNLFRERSTLSKAFSGVSVAAGVATGAIAATKAGAPGAEPLMIYFATYAGMMVSSAANVASHYTRNTGPTISFKVEKKSDEDNIPPAPL